MEKLSQDMLDKMVMEELQSTGTVDGKRPVVLDKLMAKAKLKRGGKRETREL